MLKSQHVVYLISRLIVKYNHDMQNVLWLLPLISCRCANLTSIIFCNDLNRWPPACADTGYLFEINGCCLCAISLHLSLPFCVLFTGFLCWLEPYLYGVCERRVLPGTAPHLCGEVNRPPPEGLRYPETPLTASALGTADFSQRPSGILRSPWPDCSALSLPNTKNLCFLLSSWTANHKQLSWMG